jgi:hypothetical protein
LSLFASLGRTFIVAAYIPSLLFVILNGVLGLAVARGLSWSVLQEVLDRPMASVEVSLFLFVPVALGAMLVALNTLIIRFYEGAPPFERNPFLAYFLRRNRQRQKERYQRLRDLKEKYRTAPPGRPRDSVAVFIEKEHNKLFDESKGYSLLPYDERRVMPTDLGNAFALMEEYPDYRYSMDGVTFWQRMLGVIPTSYQEMLGDEKAALDFLLNLSLLSYCFGLEVIVAGLLLRSPYAAVGLLFLALGYLLYRNGVLTTLAMGELVKSCYDLYRHELMKEFGIEPPGRLQDERQIWQRLAYYIITGEAFYYPQAAEREKVDRAEENWDDAAALRELLQIHRRNLSRLEQTEAKYGLNVPLDVLNAMDEEREKIEEITRRLDELGAGG